MSAINSVYSIFYAAFLVVIFISSGRGNQINLTVDDVPSLDDSSEGFVILIDQNGVIADSPDLSDAAGVENNKTTTIDEHSTVPQLSTENPGEHANSNTTTPTESSIETSVVSELFTNKTAEHENSSTSTETIDPKTTTIRPGNPSSKNPQEHGESSTATETKSSETSTSLPENPITGNPEEPDNSTTTSRGFSTSSPVTQEPKNSSVSTKVPDAASKSLSQEIKERLERGDVLTVVILVLIILVGLAIMVGVGICYKTRKLKRRGTIIDDSYNFADITNEPRSESRDNPTYQPLGGTSAVQMTNIKVEETDEKVEASSSKQGQI